MPVLIVLFAVGAVALGAWSVSTVIEACTGARRSAQAMQGYETVNVRDQEMLKPVSERLIGPIAEGILGVANRLTPAGYTAKVKHDIVLAGSPPGLEVDRFLILKVFGAASGVLWIPLGIRFLDANPFLMVAFIGLAWTLCFLGPDLSLKNRIESRRKEISRGLSDTLDLLVISVEAGLGFEQALDRTASTVDGPLSEEIRRVLQEIRMGASRADALRALDERTNVEDLRTFIIAMLQADTFGVSIARILRSQADEIRLRRRQAAQEIAQKVPIKMLFPLVVCIFPAIFVIVLMPGLISVFENFK